MKRPGPATIATAVAIFYVLWRLVLFDGNPVGLFELGTQFLDGDQVGSEGYDGQFSYYIAIDPRPSQVAAHLDVPAYRYQRILFPLISRVLGLGISSWIPWTMLLTNLVAHWTGTYAVGKLLQRRGVSEWYALSYGLWVGLIAPIGLGLNEPLAYGLVAVGVLMLGRARLVAGPLILGASLFAKETAVVFVAAALLSELFGPRRRRALAAYAFVTASYVAWQAYLFIQFDAIGLGSGGAMATSFELIPFMGLLRIGSVSMPALGLFLVIFGPSIVLPALWGVLTSIRDLLRRAQSIEPWLLLTNGLSIMVLPFSTFREPLGLVRFSDGLVLAVLLYAAAGGHQRPLRYSLLWTALLAMLIS
jgi:hypothetical protein